MTSNNKFNNKDLPENYLNLLEKYSFINEYPSFNKKIFSKRLNDLMQINEINSYDLSEKLETSITTVHDMKKECKEAILVITIFNLAFILKCSVDYLIGISNNRETDKDNNSALLTEPINQQIKLYDNINYIHEYVYYNEKVFLERLKKLRNENNYTLKKIAQYLNMTKQNYCKIENGKIKRLKINYIKKLALLYKCSVDYLVGASNDKELTRERKPGKLLVFFPQEKNKLSEVYPYEHTLKLLNKINNLEILELLASIYPRCEQEDIKKIKNDLEYIKKKLKK